MRPGTKENHINLFDTSSLEQNNNSNRNNKFESSEVLKSDNQVIFDTNEESDIANSSRDKTNIGNINFNANFFIDDKGQNCDKKYTQKQNNIPHDKNLINDNNQVDYKILKNHRI